MPTNQTINEFDSDSDGGFELLFRNHIAPEVLCRHESKAEIRRLLTQACHLGLQATVSVAHSPSPFFGKFTSAEGGTVAILMESEGILEVPSRSLCTVIFTAARRQCMFFSMVLGFEPGEDGSACYLNLKVPLSLDEVQARWNDRFPLESGPKATVAVRFDDGSLLRGDLKDVGRGGFEAMVAAKSPVKANVGSRGECQINWGKGQLCLPVELRWRNGEYFGFCFDHFQYRTVISAPPELEDFISFVQTFQSKSAA